MRIYYEIFIKRALAFAVDFFLLFRLTSPALHLAIGSFRTDEKMPDIQTGVNYYTSLERFIRGVRDFDAVHTSAHFFIMTSIVLLYFVILECAPWGATIGKLALGIRVVDERGRRIGFFRSLLYSLSTFLSILPAGMGFLTILVTRNEQALHDFLCRCRVVVSRPLF
ncbi:MAG: RDD family protein [Puniceicoccales bacterium]|jgi:uncharacterized RDD family membrane protein YckC|nr:RDD family protein [Puniceicoccales bacterium]